MTSSPLQLIATLVAVATLMTAGVETSHAKNRSGGGGRSFSGKSMGRSMNRSMSRSMNRSMGRSMNRSMGRSKNRSMGGNMMSRKSNGRHSMSRHSLSRNSMGRSAMNRNVGGGGHAFKGRSNQTKRSVQQLNRATGNSKFAGHRKISGRMNSAVNKSIKNTMGRNPKHLGGSHAAKPHQLANQKLLKGTGKKMLGGSQRDHRNVRDLVSKGRLTHAKNKLNVDKKLPEQLKGRFTNRMKDLKNDHRLKDFVNNPKTRDLKFKDKFGGAVKNHLKDLHLNNNKRGRLSPIYNLIRDNHRRSNVCIDQRRWCHTKPKHCHWWYDWCKPIRYVEPVHFVTCSWNYVNTDYVVNDQVVVADASWYLGLKAMLLPGQGVGIEEVTPGSPADQVGLAPGMVITRCNGIDLVDETALSDVIAQSQGVLQMDLILADDGGPATCVVVMQRMASMSF